MGKGAVRYTIGENGEIMRVMPSGHVSFSDSLMQSMRDMKEMQDGGYEVLIDDEPLVPKTGFLGWLHRLIDRLPAGKGGGA
ncbi:hypothetical protein [Pseudoxanthomonas winnipegensis]|uniref:hypothetical protein n=1 Tax=Pseudoxanthomonas winnipegensis TaxID=2480810 RepID=UPI00102D98A4|nr:hypothetical protein [Pseudoxanthomonas winnipegensis]RZZ85645.1 hypothetical protein EA663_11580 [Pseudoxanthomonas winnipegensis]